MRLLATAAVGAGLLVSPVSGQSVLVHVTAAESGKPLPGAFVSLLDDRGRVIHSALTGESGDFLFPPAAAGPFRVRAESIGRETQTSGPLSLREGESHRVPLSLPFAAIQLAEIRVEADERCRLRPDEASQIAHVWEAARKALAVQAWTDQQRLYQLELSTYVRDLDSKGRRVEQETRTARTTATRTPFASLSPEELSRGGFVRPLAEGGYQYYAPDAATLLSDIFLDSHCFRLKRSADHPGSVGLVFEPVRNGERPEIQGTFWLSESTSQLRFLDFQYTWTPYEEARGVAEGRVEFEALPDGAWIIGRWWIRAPILVRHANLARAGDSGIRVAGIRETGGEVIGVSAPGRQMIARVRRGSVRGVVWDSIRAGALVGATVYLSGTGYAASTDGEGQFVFEGLPAGVFTASFAHPRLDSLGILAPVAEAEVAAGKTTALSLAIPSAATILLAACRAEERETGAAVLSGIVKNQTTGEPIPGATVRVEWQTVERTKPTIQATDRWFEVRADGEGRYTACGIPIHEAIRVHATFLKYRGAIAELAFADTAHAARDLTIALPAGLMAGGMKVPQHLPAAGAQGIQGVLVERTTGTAVRSAEITVRNASGEVVASGLTDDRGFFRLRTPAPGQFLLTARALGYGELANEAVQVGSGALTVLEIQMVPAAIELEPIVVTADARAFQLELEGFYRRQSDGLGVFMSPELFERRRPRRVSDLLFGVPGTYVAEPTTGAGGRAIYFRSGIRFSPRDTCWPMVYVNRHLVSTGGFSSAGGEPTALDDVVHASDVWAMEVYRSPAEIPPEFNGPNAGCGVIVLWTRRGAGGA